MNAQQAPAPAARRRLDLRLAGVALGAWLSALAVLYAGPALGAGLAIGAGLAAAITVGVRSACARRPRPPAHRLRPGSAWFGLAVAVLLGAVLGGAATTSRVAVRDSPALSELVRHHATVRIEMTARDDPRPARGDPGRPPLYVLTADVHRVTPPDGVPLRLDARLLVLAGDAAWRSVLPGQSIVATGRLLASGGGDLRAAVMRAAGAPHAVGEPPWHQRAAGVLRAGLQRACAPLPDEPGGLLPGLVVGDTTALPPQVADDFLATGMTHLTAVSGSNVAVIVGAVLLLARWCRARPEIASALALAGLVGFVVLARPSPSVLRAAVMGGLGLIALASARQRAAVPALCAAVTALVVVDPELASDAGFALSVLATGGLLLLAPGWRDALRRRGVPPGVAEALAVPAAAQLACAPVVAAISGEVSLVAVPANLLAVPAVAPATVLGVVSAVLSPVWSTGAEAAAWLGHWPAWWLVTVARYGAGVPAGAVPWPPGAVGGLLLAAVLVGLLLAVRRPVWRRMTAVVVVAAVLGALPVRLVASGWPPDGWVVVACTVGQGDAAVLPVADGVAVVVDTGPDPAAVDRCLRDLGIVAVPVLVITHFHADHVAGTAGVFRGRTVGGVVSTSWTEPAAGRSLVHEVARSHAVPVAEVGRGWSYEYGLLQLTAIGPPWTITGTRSDPNNNSLVLRAEVRGVSVLLAGDAEGEEQAAVLDAHGAGGLRCDVLKVAHHGSAYQDLEFLGAVDPRVALVSVGTDNPYGHPNPSVLDRLQRSGARVLRTDTGGDTAAILTPAGLGVVSSANGAPYR